MNTLTKKKRGRPVGYRVDEPRNKSLNTKVTETQLTNYKTASEQSGKTFSAWVRDSLDKAVLDADVNPEHPIDRK